VSRVLAVNNYPTPERFARLVNAFEEQGAKVASAEWDEVTTKKFGSFDGVVLSGSPDMMSQDKTRAKYAREIEAIRESSTPLLGVCFGHQMIAVSFGSRVVEDTQHVLRMVKTTLLAPDRIFEGLPRTVNLLESRHEVVETMPSGFDLLAKSETSPIAAMKHAKLPIYGLQSHPERFTKEDFYGSSVIRNFVESLR
jgi:GMP synthase (glutamine-hydrolysing)